MIEAIVTDIEGTTSSLSFVKEVLFPYSKQHLAAFIRQRQADPHVQQLLDDTRRWCNQTLTDEEVINQLLRWIAEDNKATPLKALQGLIWEDGYRQGAFKGHLYEDAYRCLKKWHEQGLALYVFSSGSVQAQKLLFAHTEHGDLTGLFSGFFDTTIGHKREGQAYLKILEAIQKKPAAVLFLSDIKEELDAARAVGMQTNWLVRDGIPDPKAVHPQVATFDAIQL